MTTKPRRSKQTQAYDILAKLLKAQETKADKEYAAYEETRAAAKRTRTAMEALRQEPLPGMEPTPPAPPAPLAGAGDELFVPISGGTLPTTYLTTAATGVAACPHVQTETRKDGYHYCFSCGQRVIRSGE